MAPLMAASMVLSAVVFMFLLVCPVFSYIPANSSHEAQTVTNDRSEARVDPLAALLVQGQTGKY